MSEPSKKSEAQERLVSAFRVYLQAVIMAQQFGVRTPLSANPDAKTSNFCIPLTKVSGNTLAEELAAPVLAIIQEIYDATVDFYRPLYHKTLKDPAKQAECERVLFQLDFALALITGRLHTLTWFRARRTKCFELLCNIVREMNNGAEAAKIIRRWQKEFPDRAADGSIMPGPFFDQFAWDTYERVAILNDFADEFPDHVRTAARQMHGWPMLIHRHTNNRKRFAELAKRLELGVDYPLDATEGARFRPDTPLVRYLDALVFKLNNIRDRMGYLRGKSADDEREHVRSWLRDGKDAVPTDQEVEAIGALKQLPPLTKATAIEWAEKAVVPVIMATDACDWKNCEEPAFQKIAKQKGVKSRATFKSRLLSAVSATLRRLARPE